MRFEETFPDFGKLWDGKKVLVIGGTGQTGSYLVERLVSYNADVHIVSRGETGQRNFLVNVLSGINKHEFDILGKDSLRDLLWTEKFDYVFNLAAVVGGIDYNISHQADTYWNNLQLLIKPMFDAIQEGVPKYLTVSSACVYNDNVPVPTHEDDWRLGYPEPSNLGYGLAKISAELYARWSEEFIRQTGNLTKIFIARPFNTISPREKFDGTSHAVAALIMKFMNGDNPVVVFGDGEQKRIFIHADDVAKGLLLVSAYGRPFLPYNIGHVNMYSIRQIVEIIKLSISKFGYKIPEIIYDSMKPVGYLKRAANTERFESISKGWLPNDAGVEETIEEMVKEYKNILGC